MLMLIGFFAFYVNIPYDLGLETEKNFHLRRNKQRLEKQKHKARETSHKMAIREGNKRRTLRDFITLGAQGISSSTARPNVKAYNFELKPTLISMV